MTSEITTRMQIQFYNNICSFRLRSNPFVRSIVKNCIALMSPNLSIDFHFQIRKLDICDTTLIVLVNYKTWPVI